MIQTSNIRITSNLLWSLAFSQICPYKSKNSLWTAAPAMNTIISLSVESTGKHELIHIHEHTQTCRQTKWKGESGLMSMVLLPPLSVCSLISLSVSSCMLASPAGPSCYHGDESRHRLSALISCMLPTGIFLDSPLVIVCVLSFQRKSTLPPSFCLSSPWLIPLCCLLCFSSWPYSASFPFSPCPTQP